MVETASDPEDKPVILVADDDEMQRFLMGEALEAEGFNVHLVGDGSAAIDTCRRLQPDVVLLLDVVMPGIDGFTACSEIRRLPHGEQMPIVMVTGQEDLESIARAYEAGATDFIAKPLNWTLLRHRIRYVYRAGATLKQLLASEMRLAEAQRIAHLGSWEWVPGDKQLDCSIEVLKIFAFPHQDSILPLSTLFDRIHPEDRGSFETELARLANARTTLATEFRVMLEDDMERVVEVHATAGDARPHQAAVIKGTFQDVTERRLTEAKLHHLSHHDPLTGLPNRPLFQDRLEQALARARREGVDAAVICIDIDHFKDINDTYGHAAGDLLLQDIAERLHQQVRDVDTVARLGGDTFAICTGRPGPASGRASGCQTGCWKPSANPSRSMARRCSSAAASGWPSDLTMPVNRSNSSSKLTLRFAAPRLKAADSVIFSKAAWTSLLEHGNRSSRTCAPH